MGEGAMRPEARCHPDRSGVDAAGMWGEGHASYPGRSVLKLPRVGGQLAKPGARDERPGRDLLSTTVLRKPWGAGELMRPSARTLLG